MGENPESPKRVKVSHQPAINLCMQGDNKLHRAWGGKMAQMMVIRILVAIYEPLFLECLYGFRPGKSMQNYYERIAIYKTELRLALKTEEDGKRVEGTLVQDNRLEAKRQGHRVYGHRV